MNDSLAKLLEYIEPRIVDIQEHRFELKALSEVYKTIKEIVELGKKSYLEILDYYDQDFIIRSIKISERPQINQITKYKTCRYLLKNQDIAMKELPQYKEAENYLKNLVTYLTELYQKIDKEYTEKKLKLEEQELFNKYHILLTRENIFISDAEEFLSLLDFLEISGLERLSILIDINECNIKFYNKEVDNQKTTVSDVNLNEIKKIIEENKDILTEEKLIEPPKAILAAGKLDEEAINYRKIYLINQIQRSFDNFEYDEAATYYKEYQSLLSNVKELKKQMKSLEREKDKKLKFVMNNDKSLVREYLTNCNLEYQSPILKNLLDIERENELVLPEFCYKGKYLYIKQEFIVKTVYTFLEDGCILVLGIIDKNTDLNTFLIKNQQLIDESFTNQDTLTFEERNLILKNIELEDIVLTINLDLLDVKMEEENAR